MGLFGPHLQCLAPFGEGLVCILSCFHPSWALICLVVGLLPLGLFCFVQDGVMLCLFVLFGLIFHSWNLLVINPNSEFGVHLSRFFGGLVVILGVKDQLERGFSPSLLSMTVGPSVHVK